jgi:hypothetical protein
MNDYQDLVFLISKYGTDVARYNQNIDKGHRQAFFQKYAGMNQGHANFVQWMRQTLGLEGEQQPPQPATTSEWVWDETYSQFRRLFNGEWQWAPA